MEGEEDMKKHIKRHATDRTNLTEWLSIAQELGLHVVLRLGSYMDAKQDMGGFPAWLLNDRPVAHTIECAEMLLDILQRYKTAHQRLALHKRRTAVLQ